jgi:hypothetical protein
LLVPRLANNQVVQGVAVDSVRNRVYAVTSGKRGRTAYLYVIEDSGQRAIPIPWPAAGPVVNQRFNKVYVWSGTGALD